MPLYFWKGILLGLAIAVPVGPIGILCIRRSITFGQMHGLITGLGAATADAFYGAVAAFGFTAFSALLLKFQNQVEFFGGLFLGWMAWGILKTKPSTETGELAPSSIAQCFISTILLTISNPATLLAFIAVYTALNVTSDGTYANAAALILGVFSGSAIWWLFLSWVTSRFRSAMSLTAIMRVNLISGALLFTFSIFAVIHGILKWNKLW
jgi:threonine/homoserine/homoserine lactone efflux protein